MTNAMSFTQKCHMLTHTGEKPHNYIQCDKTFGRTSALNRHVLIHGGEKPHQCTQPGKFFAVKSCLTIHTKTHTNLKR